MVGLGQPVFDSVKKTEPVEGMATEARGWPLPILGQIGELDAVVGKHGVDTVWNGFNERFEEETAARVSAFSTSSTTANFEVRSMATNR